ncbi:hypothetical protein [Spirillospora sp. NPDC048819]|uniref:hypothetical protein n=1 Tax=Spirillospora sp. NPDC048819 TaxID=3155268 RepID=UPI0033F57E39
MKISICVEISPSIATAVVGALPLTTVLIYLAILNVSGTVSARAMLPVLALSIMLAATQAYPRPRM